MSTVMSITHINIHEHHSCQSTSKASFTELQFRELQLRKLHLRSSDFKASFTKAPASKLHFQSFTYKASVHVIQRPPPNNRHFGLFMD
ncbi:hypothetical protein ACFX2G_003995 [Malus domestica]